jgi:hypothetical protein
MFATLAVYKAVDNVGWLLAVSRFGMGVKG